jgi:hypothetical protein
MLIQGDVRKQLRALVNREQTVRKPKQGRLSEGGREGGHKTETLDLHNIPFKLPEGRLRHFENSLG